MLVKFDDITVTIENEEIKNRIKKYIVNKAKIKTGKKTYTPWTETDLELLKQYHEQGISNAEIARLMNRRLPTVQIKVWKLKQGIKNKKSFIL